MTICARCHVETPASPNFCPACGADFSSSCAATLRSWVFLTLAIAWSVLTIGVCLAYHAPEPLGVLSMTINGHTYTGNPPALTLYQRDSVSFFNIVFVLAAGLFVTTLDLSLRTLRHSRRTCGGALAAGAGLLVVSILGLLLGLASVGVVGFLLIMAGLSIKQKASTAKAK